MYLLIGPYPPMEQCKANRMVQKGGVKRPYVTQQNSRQPVVAKVVVLDKDLPSH